MRWLDFSLARALRVLAAAASCHLVAGCAHHGVDAWPVLADGEHVVACAPSAPCTLTMHDASAYTRKGAGKIAVLRLAAATPLQVHHNDNAPTALAWLQQTGAHVTFNAGFYRDAHTHVGLLKTFGQWLQPQRHRPWQGLMVSGPHAAAATTGPGDAAQAHPTAASAPLPMTQLIDLQPSAQPAADARAAGVAEAQEDFAERYAHVVQSMVLIDANGALRCNDGRNAASRTAVAVDDQGTLYVVVTQGALTLGAFARFLCEHVPNLALALNLDGGHEAQLALRAGPHVLSFVGAYGSRSGAWPVRRGLPYVWALADEGATP